MVAARRARWFAHVVIAIILYPPLLLTRQGEVVADTKQASISMLQRRLRLGYNRAARMVEEMERIGLVGAAETNGNREVLAPVPVDD